MIGRCSDGDTPRNCVCIDPDFGPVGAWTHRKVKVKAKRHTRRTSVALRCVDLGVGKVLKPKMEFRPFSRSFARCRTGR